MRRRYFIAGTLSLPAIAHGQDKPGAKKIGYAYVGPPSQAAARLETILSGVRASGQSLSNDDIILRVTENDTSKLGPTIREVLDQPLAAFIAGGRS